MALRCIEESDLLRVWEWRNHPQIRQCMYNQEIIPYEKHVKWYQNLQERKDCCCLIYESIDGVPQGVVSFSRIDLKSKNTDWGFYAAPGVPKGTGTVLGKEALNYAFSHLKLHKVNGEVLDNNVNSQRFHQKLGFILEGIRKENYFDGEHYHDIYLYGLLETDWLLGNIEDKLKMR